MHDEGEQRSALIRQCVAAMVGLMCLNLRMAILGWETRPVGRARRTATVALRKFAIAKIRTELAQQVRKEPSAWM
jgi:hypothetical protein